MEMERRGNMKTKEKTIVENDDEPEINYRGIKAMPFIIGDVHNFFPFFPLLIQFHLSNFLSFLQ